MIRAAALINASGRAYRCGRPLNPEFYGRGPYGASFILVFVQKYEIIWGKEIITDVRLNRSMAGRGEGTREAKQTCNRTGWKLSREETEGKGGKEKWENAKKR